MPLAHYLPLKARCESQMRLEVCDGCSACHLRCAHDISLTREEREAIRAHVRGLSLSDSQSLENVLAQDKRVDLGDEVCVAMCRYWDRETLGCAIYPVRPLICRLLGHVEWLPCPIEKVTVRIATSDALDLMKAYAKEERKTFAEWDALELDSRQRTD